MIRLKIGGVPEHFNLPWRLAIEEGAFEKINMRLHWSDMPGGTGQMIRGLESESIDIAVLLTEGVSKAILEGLPAKILSYYVTSPLRWGIHVPFESNIETPADLNKKTFAISREGSGSHLMTYVEAEKQKWDMNSLKFRVVGDLYGGLWSLENNKAQGFLWEKYTTNPFVKQNKCKFIGEVVTPWPCFVIVASEKIKKQYKKELFEMIEIVCKRAAKLKKDSEAIEKLSWRYHLEKEEVKNWLKETEWAEEKNTDPKHIDSVISFLLKANLIKEENSKDYLKKLF